ncbi:MAG: YidC/Oxa1 family insertase periplasmic-domain containing protein [bacterium]
MKKFLTKDTLILVALFTAMLAWGPLYQKFFPAPPTRLAPPVVAGLTNAPAAGTGAVAAVTTSATTPVPLVPELRQAVAQPRAPEAVVELTNGLVRLTLSSYGASVKRAELPAFAIRVNSKDPVILDFEKAPALTYRGLDGLDETGDFTITVLSNGTAARLEATTPAGLRLTRRVTLGPRYEVMVADEFANTRHDAQTLPPHSLSVGSMAMLPGETKMTGMDFLGIDTLFTSGENTVRHWSSKAWFSDELTLVNFFDEAPRRGKGCVGRPAMTKMLPLSINEHVTRDMAWVAVRNKFFVQILNPKEGAVGCDLIVDREAGKSETADNPSTWQAAAIPSRVAAALYFPARPLAAGETVRRECSYYVGPKEISSIAPMGLQKKNVMDFGMFRWFCEILLWSLNKLYWLIPNYGVAIILLTLIVRVLFWPLTHKGTESMKRLQELQPQIKDLQAKYKDKPQTLHAETMALYKTHKVNPLGGCLPMLVQIPVFFALFSVLRSGVELRFAPFLWVQDLSTAENLFAGVLPIPLNLLPLLMTVTQIWQQKLTPAAGDPMQQKMMMWMMPLMMLMFLYSMPSGLVLYWTANQAMMIIQLMWQHRAKKAVVSKQ